MTDEQKLEYLYSDMGNVSCIRRELVSSSENAVAIGFYLNEIQRLEYWKATKFCKEFKTSSYKTSTGILKFTRYTFYDYCKDEFNFSRRSVDRYLNIFMAFGKCSNGCRTKFIEDKYKNYTSSQLSEMLGLSEKVRDKVISDMTVKDIRDLKSNNKEVAADERSDEKMKADVKAYEDYRVVTFMNKPDSIAPEDVSVDLDKDYEQEDKIFKRKKYHVCSSVFDKFVSTPSQYSQQFVKLQEYLSKGYLARIVLYAPEDDKEAASVAADEIIAQRKKRQDMIKGRAVNE